ncbi:MAG: BBP7 family outer membrane beta-barrel protein [Thermoanaerobaculia bacterium]
MLRLRILSLAFVLLLAPVATAQTAPRFQLTLEPTAWWFKESAATIPLVTDGFLGQAGTHVLLGGDRLDTRTRAGLRLTASFAWSSRWSVEASAFFVPSRSTRRSVASSGTSGSTDLFISYLDARTGTEEISELSFSPQFAGTAREEQTSRLFGADLNVAHSLRAGRWRLEGLVGARVLSLHETFAFTTSSPNLPPEPLDVWETRDEFTTSNRFVGLQAGARARRAWGSFAVSGSAKVALGVMTQSVRIEGALITNDFDNYGATQTFSGGYFAVTGNAGQHSRRVFTVVPELGLDLGYELSPSMSISLGYGLLAATDVVRPGRQIDRRIDPTQSLVYGGEPQPGPAAPPSVRSSFEFQGESFFAQNLHLGLTVRF